MTDLEAFIEYNKRDVELTHRVHDKIVSHYRLEYLPRYGSAWYNMILLDIATPHYKGEDV